MDGGYYKKVIEYAPLAQTMNISIGNASSMHVSVIQSGINLESIGFTYSESKLHELNLD